MGEDEELEMIKYRMLKNLMKKDFEEKKQVIDKPVEVTDSNFMEIIQRNPFVVIDCWAPWCAPCRAISPIIDDMARNYAGRILFGKLNVEENQVATTYFQIMSIPTLLIFKNGKLIDRIIGALPRHLLEPRITQYL
ncbi:MAG: thioredoxin [Candidatus Methanomethylicia archaeon]